MQYTIIYIHIWMILSLFRPSMNKQQAFLFFRTLHKDQTYSDWSPYRPHLLRVGNILQYYLEFYWEWNKKTRDAIIISWYGHDSLEDTDISLVALEKKFGKQISDFIFGITNEQSDAHTDTYVQKVANAPEEIRLIKLADMCDNYQWMIYKTNTKKIAKFFKEKIMPIIEPMYQKIITTSFSLYPKTSEVLFSDVRKYHNLAIGIIDELLDF